MDTDEEVRVLDCDNGDGKVDFYERAFEIVEMAAKGKCLRSKRDIKAGEVILRERPLIHMPDEIYQLKDVRDIETWLDKRINKLTCAGREAFFDLTDSRSSVQTTLGIFFTNDMNYVDGDAALFPIMSRTNHSCYPNSDFISRPELDVQDLIAIRDIDKGEEITLSYLPSTDEGSDVREVRQSYLREWYNFHCACSLCVLNESEARENDELRQRVKLTHETELAFKTAYELEELFDNLSRICVKLPHHIELCKKILVRALNDNNVQLASRSIVEGWMKACIIQSPDTEIWDQLRKCQMVSIKGRLFLFP